MRTHHHHDVAVCGRMLVKGVIGRGASSVPEEAGTVKPPRLRRRSVAFALTGRVLPDYKGGR
jgi:hypothetical protein